MFPKAIQPPTATHGHPKTAAEADPSSLIDIAVLDLGPLYEEGVRHYLALDPERARWSPEKRARLRIRTECRWGRAEPSGDQIFLLNEKGEGPREPLSDTVCACVSLYAELEADPAGEPGFTETKPFCKVAIDRDTAARLRSSGWVALERFLDRRIPELEEAYEIWRSLLVTARDRARAKRAEKARAKERDNERTKERERT